MKKVEICLLVHNYQLRLSWDLMSLLNQQGLHQDFEIVVAVCSLVDNGVPTTEEVCEFYNKQGLRVKHQVIKDRERFAKRGCTRNDQIELLDDDSDYVLFSDCDMVYEPKFFGELLGRVKEFEGTKTLFAVGRWSTHDHKPIDEMIAEQMHSYPYVNIDYGILRKTCTRKMRNVGAGFFQMVESTYVQDGYVKERRNKDRHMFKEGLNPISDIQFRQRIGDRTKLKLEANQYHLNHKRDPEAGKHLEEQR